MYMHVTSCFMCMHMWMKYRIIASCMRNYNKKLIKVYLKGLVVEVGCEDTTSFLLSKINDHLVAPCASSSRLASWVTFLSSWIFADSSRRGPRLVAAPDWTRLLSCSWLAASCVFVFGLRIRTCWLSSFWACYASRQLVNHVGWSLVSLLQRVQCGRRIACCQFGHIVPSTKS